MGSESSLYLWMQPPLLSNESRPSVKSASDQHVALLADDLEPTLSIAHFSEASD